MDKIQELLASLAKVPGAEDLTKKIASEVKGITDAHDTATAKLATVTKERDTFKTESAKHKADLDNGTAGKDEAVKKLAVERDDWRSKHEAAEAKLKRVALETAVGNALGIADPIARADAAASFIRVMPADAHLNDNGQLVGVSKAIETFKAERSYYFGAAGSEAKGNGGPRPGGDPPPLKKSGTGAGAETEDKRSAWATRLEGTGAIPKAPVAAAAPAK